MIYGSGRQESQVIPSSASGFANSYWDICRLLKPNDELDLEARKRSTNLYLSTGMAPMFPPELATGPMSLIQGKVCSALSFGVVLNDNGGVEDYTIHSSLILHQ